MNIDELVNEKKNPFQEATATATATAKFKVFNSYFFILLRFIFVYFCFLVHPIVMKAFWLPYFPKYKM